MPYRKGGLWFNDKDERIHHPKEYFKAAGLEDKYNQIEEKHLDELIDKAESQQMYEEERQQELEKHGYADEDDYAEAYWGGETGEELGIPPSLDPEDCEDHDDSPSDYIPENHEDCDDSPSNHDNHEDYDDSPSNYDDYEDYDDSPSNYDDYEDY